MKDILVWAEQRDGQLAGVALEILKKALDLAAILEGQVAAVVIGQECRQCAAELIAHGAGRVFVVEDSRLALLPGGCLHEDSLQAHR